MQLFRTKTYKKEYTKISMTDKQYAKHLEYVAALLKGKPLPPEAKDHKLIGNFKEFRELHISGVLLLIYLIENNILKLVRIGTHAQLFQ